MPDMRKITVQALELGPIERAQLIEELLASFGGPADQEIDHLWEVEAEARIDAFDQGQLSVSSAAEVFKRII